MPAHARRRRAWAWSLAGLLVVAIVISVAAFGRSSSAPLAAANDEQTVFRICPVGDCSNYPDPSAVRGITISALQGWLIDQHMIYKQISAMRRWHANTIRLQVLQDKLVGERGQRYAPVYMALVDKFVRYSLRKHLTVVIAAQTELSLGWVKNESLPTAATDAFWDRMTAKYGHDPRIVFDLFNEPRKCSWEQWQAAMQPLVDHVRAAGSVNQIWVEGRWWASTLEGVPLLHGQGLVYSFHHPGSPWPWQAPVGVDTWQRSFGYLADRHVPVIDGEFTNYVGGYYWPRATRTVTAYFHYLRAHRIGLVAWSLAAGVMSSIDYTHALREPHADGRLVQRYFWGRL